MKLIVFLVPQTTNILQAAFSLGKVYNFLAIFQSTWKYSPTSLRDTRAAR